MKDGFIKVAAAVPHVTVADPAANAEAIKELIDEAVKNRARIIVFPELALTGYTCGELFFQDTLIRTSDKALLDIAEYSKDADALIFIGIPLKIGFKLYNAAAAICHGQILGFTTKTNLPGYSEFYEERYFDDGPMNGAYLDFHGHTAPAGHQLLYQCDSMPSLIVGAEICEDLWVPHAPSDDMTAAGASVIVNLSASDELTGKSAYRRQLVSAASAKLYCGYIYANAGMGESTQDVVYSGHSLIAENGTILQELKPFSEGIIYSEIDIDACMKRREQMTTYRTGYDGYPMVSFSLGLEETALTRYIVPHPFVPENASVLSARCDEILNIQACGLRKRLEHTHSKTAVVGISGGLDSTLAFLVTVRAFDMLGLDRHGIIAVTMPGFGTTDRTHDNAVRLIQELGASFREVNIAPAVRQHFADIGQDESVHDVTYENSQARERTQILMDIANKENGLVIGTGDLSELALGWATYNGDHMSMYGVNASVPKTLVRHLVKYYADYLSKDDAELKATLYDVLDTPVSPELLPPEANGEIAQKTEDLVGPYELHDFFLYYVMRYGFTPSKIYRLACRVFADGAGQQDDRMNTSGFPVGHYDRAVIKKWLVTFYRRFFSQQFKRSALPDGPKVGTVALSPRGDWRMPSDASGAAWIHEAENL